MAKNRYHKDYELLEFFDEKGRLKRQTRYIGKEFVFAGGQAEAKKQGKKFLMLLIAGWICFIGAMIPNSMAMRTLFIALPFVFTAPVLVLATDLGITIIRMQVPMERRHADRMDNRLPPVCLFLFLFPAFALLGEVIRILSGGAVFRGDYIFLICAALLVVAGGYCFSLRKAFVTEPA